MTVHVDEVHTDVMPAVAPAGHSGHDAAPKRLDAVEDAWREAHRSAAMMARRTSAEGFDD